jgi:acetolactate synthase-1/2/3 large subunit
MRTRRRTTGQALVDGLLAHDVDTVFGLPGVQTYALFDALAGARDQISVISPRHEQTCGYMAMGYAQSTGRVGVCSVVPGPGVLNASAALLTAAGSATPVVCLTSEIPTEYMGRGLGHLHEMPDQRATLASFTKWAATVDHPAQAPHLVGEAFAVAAGGRPGPVVLAAPWDVLGAEAEVPPVVPRRLDRPPIDTSALARAVDILAEASNPMIMVGSGARHAADEIRELAHLLQAPVVAFRGGRGIVSDADPLGFSCAEGFECWPDTDVLLALGTRQELAWFRWPDRPSGQRTINVDIDPRQHVRLQPTVGLTADARDAALALLDALRPLPLRPSRLEEYAKLKSRRWAEIGQLQPHVGYLAAIRDALPEAGYFVEEISQIGFSSYFAFPVHQPRHFITAGHQGTLGFGFPTSLGVKAAHRDAPVVSVTGDGGFLFAATELATAVQYDLGVVVVVFDNGAYGNVLADQRRIYQRDIGSSLRNPDFVALAESFGADGYRAENPVELRGVLDKAIGRDRPAVVAVPMPLDQNLMPWTYLMPASRRGGTG